MDTTDDTASPTSIFHHGTLQSGIQRAIAENKVVAIFLHTPHEHTSTLWHDYWLSNSSQPTDVISSDTPPLGLVIAEKAILLKIAAGSKEAGFLKAFVDVSSVPCLVVVRNGRVLERIGRETGREEFERRLLKAVGFEGWEGAGRREPEGPPEGLNEDEAQEEIVDDIGGRHAVAEGRESGGNEVGGGLGEEIQQESSRQETQQSQTAQTLLADRARRLETEHLQREAREKAERTARANARRKEEEAASASASQPQPARDKGKQRAVSEEKQKQQARDAWLYQQKQRKDESKKERERILAQIESDKQERKAAAQRKKDLEASAGGGAFSSIPADQPSTPQQTPNPTAPTQTSLQIRLFDGTSIRSKFPSSTTLASSIRPWVHEASPPGTGGSDIPYNFRLIQPPLPSRTIEISEEHTTLLELGLAPSATLVLVPVAGATSAYASSSGQGVLGTAFSAASWVVGGVGSLLGGVWGYVPYIGGTGDEGERSNVEGARMAGSDSVTPAGRSRRDGGDDVATFYNGNSSAFEGRKDDDGGGT